ncbi:MAG TPA: hypothetical protein DCO83_04165 [Mucilaginibacter sp.]|jgi:hypothetical protein|nr:hypothetical protein [Mucilaginibacter sp.]
MKYNPFTKELYTDNQNFIKKLHCPLNKQWENLSQTAHLKGRFCDNCERTIIDTALFTDEDLSQLMLNDPHTCLKVDLNQQNLTITYKSNEQ